MDLVEIVYNYLTKLGYNVEKTHCLLCYWFHPQHGCLQSECDGASHFYSDFELLKLVGNDVRLEVLVHED